jgi:hypothetical protein
MHWGDVVSVSCKKKKKFDSLAIFVGFARFEGEVSGLLSILPILRLFPFFYIARAHQWLMLFTRRLIFNSLITAKSFSEKNAEQ